MTDITIPHDVEYFLSLGPNFITPDHNKNIIIQQTLSNVESSLYKMDQNIKDEIRSEVVFELQKFCKRNNKEDELKNNKSNLIFYKNKTKAFLKKHQDLVVCKADKGNTTVILNKNMYFDKCQELLLDKKTYKILKSDPTNKIETKLNDLLKNIKNKRIYKNILTDDWIKKLKSKESIAPKFYILPKIHKDGNPGRPITSFVNSPLYNVSKYISIPINKVVGKTVSFVKDSWHLKDIIKNIILPDDHLFVSLDVKSLFTNIPSYMVIESVKNSWSMIKEFTELEYKDFMDLLIFCLNNSYCVCNDKYYSQIFGSPMGSPLSPPIANLVMESIENKVLKSLDFKPILFKRYVDDILTIIPKNKVEYLLQKFNDFNENIQFTIEVGEVSINFLDVTIKKEGNLVTTNWYRKPTWSGRYLNFNSSSHINYKISVLNNLVDRGIKLSDSKFHTANLKIIRTTLKNNNYPTEFIDKYIKRRLININSSKSVNKEPFPTENIMVFPFIEDIYKKMDKICRKHNIKAIFQSNKNNQCIFRSMKDPTPVLEKSGLVYNIPCKDCNSVYIGQTKRKLKKRIYEHKRACGRDENVSALVHHSHDNDHVFDFENTKILAMEHNCFKLNFLEMYHIVKNKNSVNLRTDILNLNQNYKNFIKNIDNMNVS